MSARAAIASADLVAHGYTVIHATSVTYPTAPQTWSRPAADLVAFRSGSPQTWSRFTADLVAPYIEQNTAEHFFQNSLQKFRTAQL